MTVSYREAAETLWGEAGVYAYDKYAELREKYYPGLVQQVPIVIGLTSYGHCIGLTRSEAWKGSLPRISLHSTQTFWQGRRRVDDVLVHEMLHVWLMQTGSETKHDSDEWYDGVKRLSPAVLGHGLDIRRGAARKSVRVPNPRYQQGDGEPKTVVRKKINEQAVAHKRVAGWPQAFRPDDYDWGEPIYCPTY